MQNINTVKEIYARNYGSVNYYKRFFCSQLIYTEGILDFQQKLDAYWFVDNIISYLPKVINTYNETQDDFYVVIMKVRKNNSGVIEIFREGYVDNIYNEHITVVKQKLQYIDLPVYNYKFYLILSNLKPIRFTLLLTSEY